MLDTINRMIMAAITVDMSLDTTVVELDRPFRRCLILRTCKITIGISETKNGMVIIDISTKPCALICSDITFVHKRYRRTLYNAAIKREAIHAPTDMKKTFEYWKVRLYSGLLT